MTNGTTQESLEREGSSLSPENLPFELEFSTMNELPEIGVSSHGVFVTNPQYDAGMTQKVDPVECWGISHAHAQLIVDLNEELAEAVEDALNTACLRLQKTAGIKDGGFAGTFFSGHPIRRELMNVLAEYIAGDVNSCRSETKGFLLTKEMIAEAIGGKGSSRHTMAGSKLRRRSLLMPPPGQLFNNLAVYLRSRYRMAHSRVSSGAQIMEMSAMSIVRMNSLILIAVRGPVIVGMDCRPRITRPVCAIRFS